jgi:hypothetical protein
MSEEIRTARSPEGAAVVEACEAVGEVPAAVATPETVVGKANRAWSPALAGKSERTELPRTAHFAGSVHKYIDSYIKLADQNAAFLFAAVGTTLTFLNAKGVTKLWIKNPLTWSLNEALAFLAVIGLLASATASAMVLLPRRKGSPTGLVSWGAIAKCRSAEEYARLVLGTEPTGLTEATLEHCFELSRVCTHKYRAMGWALCCGGAGFVGTLIYLALT